MSIFFAVAESAPVQNQAAAHKLLQKMNSSNQGDRRPRGWKQKGKGKQEELQFFTLDEWENRKIGANHTMKNDIPDTSADEEIAWQLQNQLDVEDSHVGILAFSSVSNFDVIGILILT